MRLLAHRTQDSLVLYELDGRRDYFQGYMLPSAGRLTLFALHGHSPGFVLQYPHQSSPTRLTPFEPYPRLFARLRKRASGSTGCTSAAPAR